jgi:hypothetical protein
MKRMPKSKRDPYAGIRTAIFFIELGLEQYQTSPALRRQTGIDLPTLEAVASVRRKLLKQIPKQ